MLPPVRGGVHGPPLHRLQQDAVCQVSNPHIAWTAFSVSARRPNADAAWQKTLCARWMSRKLPGPPLRCSLQDAAHEVDMLRSSWAALLLLR